MENKVLLIVLAFIMLALFALLLWNQSMLKKNIQAQLDAISKKGSDQYNNLKNTTPRVEVTQNNDAILRTPKGQQIHKYDLKQQQ